MELDGREQKFYMEAGATTADASDSEVGTGKLCGAEHARGGEELPVRGVQPDRTLVGGPGLPGQKGQ